MPQTQSILYSVLRPLVIAGSRLFFRKIVVVNGENLPLQRPVILVANHQNAMMDPVMLCWVFPKQLHWLTRADVFKKPSINKLLRGLNMLPVYRERDKVDDLHGINHKTFKVCNERLAHNAVMCMFPEGTHRGKKQLIPLKKGVARMAINALNNGLDDICIVPVGLDYESYYHYRTTLLVKVGKPIEVGQVIGENPDQARAQNTLLSVIRAALKKVMIDIEHNEAYEQAMGIESLCAKVSGSNKLSEQFDFYHKTIKYINDDDQVQDELKELAPPYLSLKHELLIDEKLFNEKGYPFLNLILLALGLFPSLVAFIFFYPIYQLAEYTVKKVVKDPLFVNSIRLCCWTFVTPVYLLLLGFAFALFTGTIWMFLPSLLVLVSCGIIALYWWPLWKQFLHHRLCNSYAAEKNKAYSKWLAVRDDLKKWIVKLNSK